MFLPCFVHIHQRARTARGTNTMPLSSRHTHTHSTFTSTGQQQSIERLLWYCVRLGDASMWWSDCPCALWLVAWSVVHRPVLFAKAKLVYNVQKRRTRADNDVVDRISGTSSCQQGKIHISTQRKNWKNTQRFEQFFIKSDIGPS